MSNTPAVNNADFAALPESAQAAILSKIAAQREALIASATKKAAALEQREIEKATARLRRERELEADREIRAKERDALRDKLEAFAKSGGYADANALLQDLRKAIPIVRLARAPRSPKPMRTPKPDEKAHRITDETRKRIVELGKTGMKAPTIAKEVGTTTPTVYKELKKAGITWDHRD